MLFSMYSKCCWPQCRGYYHRCCTEDLWEGRVRSRLCMIVPGSLRLQQYSTATSFVSTSYRSLHRSGICASPWGSLGLALTLLCKQAKLDLLGVSGGRKDTSWFLAAILKAGTSRSGWEIWLARGASCLCLSDLISIQPSPQGAAA